MPAFYSHAGRPAAPSCSHLLRVLRGHLVPRRLPGPAWSDSDGAASLIVVGRSGAPQIRFRATRVARWDGAWAE